MIKKGIVASVEQIKKLKEGTSQKGQSWTLWGSKIVFEDNESVGIACFSSTELEEILKPIAIRDEIEIEVEQNDKGYLNAVQGKEIKVLRHAVLQAQTAGQASADGDLAEGATLPDSIKPTLQKYKSVPKEVAHKFRVSTKQEYLYTKAEDDAALGMEDTRIHTEIKHRKAIDQQLLRYAGTGATGNKFESLDKIISANSEIALVGANNADVYDIDRDAGAGFSDAYVNHNSGTDRFITDTLVLALVENMDEAGASISFFLTGNDIASDLASVYNTQIRYNNLGETKIQVGVNGIQTDKGLAAGSRVATLYDIPIIKDKNVAKDTASKFYAVDTSMDDRVGEARLYMKVAIPTMYFETGPNVNGRIFEANALVNQGIFLTSGELWCNDFSKQGKLIDLK